VFRGHRLNSSSTVQQTATSGSNQENRFNDLQLGVNIWVPPLTLAGSFWFSLAPLNRGEWCVNARSPYVYTAGPYTTTPLTFFVFLSNPSAFYVFIYIRLGNRGSREKDKISSGGSCSVATPTTSFQDALAIKFLLSCVIHLSELNLKFVCQLSASFPPLPTDGCKLVWS